MTITNLNPVAGRQLDVLELVCGREKDLLAWLSPLVCRHNVTLDLGRVRRIDAAGISALVSLYSSAKKAGHRFNVANPSPRVAEVLRLVGLEGILSARRTVCKSQASSCLEQTAA